MTTLLRTHHLPPADRFAFWQEAAGAAWVPMECRSAHRADFPAQLRTGGLGAVRVGVMATRPFQARRTPRLIRRAAPDLLKLAMPLRGRGPVLVAQDGREALLRPGEFAFYDTRRPYVTGTLDDAGEAPAVEALTLMFPPGLLPLPPGRLRRLTAVRMPADAGVGALTSRFLTQLADGLDQYGPAEAVRLSTAALEVLAARLAHELDCPEAVPPESRKRALLARVHAFIQAHLGDPDLTPPAIAAAHHISPRYLHLLFAEAGDGTTVAAWIRARRLAACRRDLTDPALADRPVAAIAARWGFAHAGHFSRQFKAAYGMPPDAYRRVHAAASPPC